MSAQDTFDREARRAFGPRPTASEDRDTSTVSRASLEQFDKGFSEPPARTIEFRRKRKSWFCFPYHSLMSIEYEPHGTLVATFSTHEVVIRGRGLNQLYQEISSTRCCQVAETERADVLGAESGVVEEIAVRDLTRSQRVCKSAPGE